MKALALLTFALLLPAASAFGQVTCSQSSDCGPGLVCWNYQCVPAHAAFSGGCVSNGDCPNGFVCDANQCVAGQGPSGSCVTDSSCPSGWSCDANKCVPGH